MNPRRPVLAKLTLSFFFVLFGAMFATAQASAADHFLNSPVPVLAQPENRHPNGGYDFVEAANGESVAVWGQSTGLFVSVRLPGGRFGEPVLAVPDEEYSSNPELAITPTGYTIMVWRQSVGGISQVMRAVREPGAPNFGPALQVSEEDFAIPNVDPQVAVADDGTAMIVWKGQEIEADDTTTRIRKRLVAPGGGLDGAITPVSAVSPAGNQFPDVVMGPTGFALVTWLVGDGVTGDQGTSWMQPGGGGSDVQILNSNSGTTLRGAIDGDGNAVIANRIGNDLIGNSRPTGPGQNFLLDQIVDLPGTQAFNPVVGMDAAGVTTVAIPYFAGGKEGIQVADRPAGAGQLFGTATKAIPEVEEVNDPSLAVGANGTALLGYTTEDDRVYAAVRGAGAPQFSGPTGPFSPEGRPTGAVIAGADGAGKGLVTYSTLDELSDDYTISALPYDDVPVVTDLNIPATVEQGKPANFSVNPVDGWADITSVEWEVDAGVKKTGNQVTHTYATPGERTVTVTVTDALGNAATAGGPIQVTAATPPDATAPKLTALSMLKKKSKRGKKNAFRFTLSETARVEIKVKRVSKGKGKRAQGKIVKKQLAAGKRRVAFRGKIGKRKLKPARYRATIVAIDGAGNRSKARNLGFRIIR